jgi:phospholipid-binding lipoprotein MlaA
MNQNTAPSLALGFALVTGGCAMPPSDPVARAEFEATNDPLEPLNRRIFDFNLFVDRILIKPVAQVYQAAIPEQGRNAIRHFLDNLGEPVVFENNLLQGEFHRADVTLGRFLFNSTFGVGGLMDLASSNGLEKQSGDLGQTLYSWGVPDGPYLVVPIFGPSNPRDAVGGAVEGYASPYGYISSGATTSEANWGRRVTNGADQRARKIATLDDLQRHSIDFYAETRSLYRQRRANELRHGEPAPMPDFDTLDK